MTKIKRLAPPLFLLLILFLLTPVHVRAETCERSVIAINARLSPKIDPQELVEISRSLNTTNNTKLPLKFVTKQQAQSMGWRPGMDLWSVPALKGKSIGGDQFKNLEGRLPKKKWREADLGYKGGHRGSKRVVFSSDGLRYVTVDHYQTFVKLPVCQ